MWANYSTDQKYFTGHIFNINLEEKSYKMSFKALAVKIQQSKNRQEGSKLMSISKLVWWQKLFFIFVTTFSHLKKLTSKYKYGNEIGLSTAFAKEIGKKIKN